MKPDRIDNLLSAFYLSHSFPVFLYDEDESLFRAYSTLPENEIFFHRALSMAKKDGENGVFTYGSFLCGHLCLQDKRTLLFFSHLGDSRSLEDIHHFLSEQRLPFEMERRFRSSLLSIADSTFQRMSALVVFLSLVLEGKEIPLASLLAKRTEKKKEAKKVAKEEQNMPFHGTYALESLIVSLVREGKPESLSRLFDKIGNLTPPAEGKLAENSLRQAKNLLIGFIAQVSKDGAIPGGLDVEEVYSTNDGLVQECENCQTVEEVKSLQYRFILDYAKAVAENKAGKRKSSLVTRAILYLKANFHSDIGIDDVVRATGCGRTKLLLLFKKETGFTIREYLLQLRLEEASLYLEYTDAPLSRIAMDLSFSSQSYFTNVFHKARKMTPAIYRQESRKKRAEEKAPATTRA